MVSKKDSHKPGKGLDILDDIGHPLRLDIIMCLGSLELSTGAIASLIDRPQPRASHHLAVLHAAGIVKRRQQGRYHLYRLAGSDFEQLALLLTDLVAEA
jgi:DNA-binding transcriptional ArsR family regulator